VFIAFALVLKITNVEMNSQIIHNFIFDCDKVMINRIDALSFIMQAIRKTVLVKLFP
jgi:hypothetical protein